MKMSKFRVYQVADLGSAFCSGPLENSPKTTQGIEDIKGSINGKSPATKTENGVNNHTSAQPVQHEPPQQLVPNQNQTQTNEKDKNLSFTNSTTITLIENGHSDINSDKDKKFITLEPKTEIKDDIINTITITPTRPKHQVINNTSIDKKKEAKLVKRPLQCLETLAEKAGITFEDQYEAANTLLSLEKQNNFNKQIDQRQQKIETNSQAEDENTKKQILNQFSRQQELLQHLSKIHQLEHQNFLAQQKLLEQQQHQILQQQQQQILQRQQQQLHKTAVHPHPQSPQNVQQQHQQHQQRLEQHLQQQQQRQQLHHRPQFQQQQPQPQPQSPRQQQLPQQQIRLQHPQQLCQKVPQAEASQHPEPKFTPINIHQQVQHHTQLFNLPGIGEVNLSFVSQHNNVGLKNMNQDIKPQQMVEGQSQVVNSGMNMSQHDNQQHHQTVTVVSSMPSNMHQVQQQQQQQQQAVSNMQQQQQQNAGITTMPPIQSLQPNSQHQQPLSTDWSHSRVQVIQQPMQNNAYLQQLYNAQGPLLMPGNLALHPSINSQQIQVIAAGKPFQGTQLAPHMITTQGKQVLQGQHVGTSPFPGYTTIPAIPTSQNQTFVFSPLGVINSQPNILPSHSQSTVSISHQQKSNEMQKLLSGGKVTHKLSTGGVTQQVPVGAQCVQVSQQPAQAQIISPLPASGQTMQFAPWQISGAIPQVWTGGLQAGTLSGGGLLAPNPIFIRGTQPDAQTSMFIQHSPHNNIQQTNANVACATGVVSKPRPTAEAMSKAARPLSNILPSSGIRPASSVSTQTSANQAQSQAKPRGKPGVRSPAPTTKQDAANQTNKIQHHMQQPKQQLVVMNSGGQMTQITGVQDKQAMNKNVQQQQQAILQQQVMQQQQQQMLQQHQSQQQLVQHYQQGMSLNMQQGALPVGSVAQSLPMATGIPQTISMLQHIHPLTGMTQHGALLGQIANPNNQSQQQSMAQILSNQQNQQHQQTLLQGSIVQTSSGMTTQQPAMTHTTALQTTLQTALDGSPIISTSLLQVPAILQEQVQNAAMAPGQIGVQQGLISTSMMPLVQVKSEDDKQPQTQQAASTVMQLAPQRPAVSEPQTCMPPPPVPAMPATSVSSSQPALPTSAALPKPNLLVPKPEVSIASQQAAMNALVTSGGLPVNPASTSVQTSVGSPHVVTTAAISQSSVSSFTSSPVPSTNSLFKSSPCTPKHFPQSPMQDKSLPKAMVKPNILTHVIEGYVIQEAGEPFAVNRPNREWDKDDKENKLPSVDEPPRKKQLIDGTTSRNESPTTTTPQVKPDNAMDSTDGAAAKIPNASKWTVSEVCDFIRNIPGCATYADEFLMQEVDGEALLLIRPQHLVMALNMKLGPALKIVACIDALRPDNEQQSQTNVD